MKIVIAGRPNTGKSTLFNQLTHSRDALCYGRCGTTRDVVQGMMGEMQIFDTAGLEKTKTGIGAMATEKSLQAIRGADAILFVVDGRAGITAEDLDWGKIVNRTKSKNAKILLLANKAESKRGMENLSEFYKLGMGEAFPISAEHKIGFKKIEEFITGSLRPQTEKEPTAASPTEGEKLRIAIMGQPNVGKSTLLNTILGENRVLVKDEPGITRDTIRIPAKFYGREILLADTAGLRRKAGITDDLETLSALKALDELEKADVVILMIDATRAIENQALGIAGRVYDAGKILCVALNKWDLVENKEDRLLQLKHQFANSFHQIAKPLALAVSAETGTGVRNMFKRIYELWDISNAHVPTSIINRAIEKLVQKRQPPMSRLKRPMRIKFASQTGKHPMRISINVGGASDIPESYTRYLMRGLATALHCEQLPMVIEYSKTKNPFEKGKS